VGDDTDRRDELLCLPAPGCYAWQIDAPSFSRVIVFSAVGTN
jgi:hypothetical protein